MLLTPKKKLRKKNKNIDFLLFLQNMNKIMFNKKIYLKKEKEKEKKTHGFCITITSNCGWVATEMGLIEKS